MREWPWGQIKRQFFILCLSLVWNPVAEVCCMMRVIIVDLRRKQRTSKVHWARVFNLIDRKQWDPNGIAKLGKLWWRSYLLSLSVNILNLCVSCTAQVALCLQFFKINSLLTHVLLWGHWYPVLDFWWHLLWVSKPDCAALFAFGRGICNVDLWSLRFISGTTPCPPPDGVPRGIRMGDLPHSSQTC